VLPFVNMSGDEENEYFSDGLTETLLHMLAQLPDLRVAARTSSFAFKGQNKSIDEIATALGVAHILEGSVQKSGERVRVTAQLIRAGDGFHVWSQNYTRPLEDIFAIQDEIAEDVAGALDSSLLGGTTQTLRGVETSNLTAYDSYLKGLEQQAIFSYGSLAIAENHFKQALARDPEFVDARLALVRNYLLQHSTGLIKDDETRASLEPLIQQVQEQQPDNRLARAFEIVTELQVGDVTRTREEVEPLVTELRNLLPLVPTETFARQRVAGVLNFFFEDSQAALEVLEAGLMIDPLDADLHRSLGGIYLDIDRNEDALHAYQKAQQLAPDNPNVYSSLARIEEENNNLVAALQWRRKATEVDPQDHELAANVAHALYKLELPEEGDRWYARVIALAPGSPVAKHAEIHRLLSRQELQNTVELCRSMISEQIENRNGAFGEAVFTYMWLMMKSGKAREAYDFLVSVRPEITNYDEFPGDFNGLMMQWSSIGLMSGFESREVRLEAWQKLTTNLDKAGFPWRDPDNLSLVWDKVITGDTEGATNSYLEGQLSKPLASDLELHHPRGQPVFPELFADPRVTDRLAELGKEHEQFREQVREMLQEPEWNQ
jgi:TolB-like protein/Flp pilus assembly protein TadD